MGPAFQHELGQNGMDLERSLTVNIVPVKRTDSGNEAVIPSRNASTGNHRGRAFVGRRPPEARRNSARQ